MKQNQKQESTFIKYIQKTSRLSFQEEVFIQERNRAITSEFKPTTETNDLLSKLNQKLYQEEERMFLLYKSIEKQGNDLIARNSINDFEIEIKLECWNNGYYEKYYPEVIGNPFFTTACDFMSFQKGTTYEVLDFSEMDSLSFLPQTKHCYTFHHLYDHTDLTLFDLCNIDEIWLDLNVTYQSFLKIK